MGNHVEHRDNALFHLRASLDIEIHHVTGRHAACRHLNFLAGLDIVKLTLVTQGAYKNKPV